LLEMGFSENQVSLAIEKFGEWLLLCNQLKLSQKTKTKTKTQDWKGLQRSPFHS